MIKTTWCFGLIWYQAAHKVRMSGSQIRHELPKILLKGDFCGNNIKFCLDF